MPNSAYAHHDRITLSGITATFSKGTVMGACGLETFTSTASMRALHRLRGRRRGG